MKQAAKNFLLDCEVSGLSPATIHIYRRVLDDFTGSLPEEKPLVEVTPTDIRNWLQNLRNRPRGRSRTSQGLSPGTIKTYTASLRAFVSWCGREGLIQKNPMANIRTPRVPRKIIPSLTRDHLLALLATWDSPRASHQRNETILIVLLDSGVRAGELLGLRLSDLDLEHGCLRVNGKGGKERLVPIAQTTRNVLQDYLEKTRPSLLKGDGNGWVFLSQRGKPLTPGELAQIFRRAKKRAGIPRETPCSPHTVRHTAALQFVRNGINAFAVQRILGHSDLNTTRLYVNQVWEDLAELHQRASPVDKMLGGVNG